MVKRVKLRQRAKFRGDRSNRCRYMAIFRFFKMATAAILDFQNLKFLTVGRLKTQKGRTASCAEFGRNPLNRHRDMAIFRFFKMAAATFLDFIFFCNFNDSNAQEGWTASPCQIWWKSVKPRPTYGDFSIFPRWRQSAILDLLCMFRTTHEGHLVVFIILKNLVGIDAVVWIICMFFDFSCLAGKRLFAPPKLGYLTPWMGRHINETMKRHILCQKDVIWRTDRQNRSISATCARDEATKKRKKDKERHPTVSKWVSKWNFARSVVFRW